MCKHKKLIAMNDFSGINIDISDNTKENENSQVCGMFTYKKYKCEDCGKIIIVLNAIVEETK